MAVWLKGGKESVNILLAALFDAQLHQRAIHCDSMQPRGDAALGLELADVAESGYEGLLHRVARFFLVVQNASCDGQERRGVMFHQLLKCKVVAGAESVDEISVVDEHRAQRSAFSRRGGH